MYAWEAIEQSLTFIEEHLTEEIYTEELANIAGLSPFYFQRLFKRLVSKPVQFLGSRWLLLLVVSIVVVWRSVPFMALVCLAGRQSIPDAIYEAAKMDGGTPRKVFWHITMPLMKPFLALGITSTSVTAINVFDEIVALSGYGDLGKNILMESYLTTFSFLNFGKGSAMTYIVLFFALLLGIFYLRNLNKEVDY